MRALNRGDLVYDKADPRHVGRIISFLRTNNGCFANVVWLATGWKSFGLPTRDLVKTEEDFQ